MYGRTYTAQIERGQQRVGWLVLSKLAHGLRVSVARLARESEGDPAAAEPVTGAPPSDPPDRPAPSEADVARVLTRRRLERGLSLEELAGATGLHPTTISKIEHRERGFTWPVLCALADALDLMVADIIETPKRTRRGRLVRGEQHPLPRRSRPLLATASRHSRSRHRGSYSNR